MALHPNCDVTPNHEGTACPGCPEAVRTITISRDALVDLLTTAACIGRDASGTTRGDVAEYLAGYGLAARSRRLDEYVTNAERVAEFLASEKAGA